MTDASPDAAGEVSAEDAAVESDQRALLAALPLAVIAGGALALAARAGAGWLLAAVAVLQLLLALGFVIGRAIPGRTGALALTGAAAVAADVGVSVWPHGRLSTLLGIVALVVPLQFCAQLARGARRVRLQESLTGTALAVIATVAPAALVQLRHEFTPESVGGKVVAGVVLVAAGGLVIAALVDLAMPAPRFDPAVRRGLLGVVAAAGLGGSVGHLVLGPDLQFAGQRGAVVGAVLGALIGLFAVASAFLDADRPAEIGRLRLTLTTLFPLALLAPVAFLLCLALRL